MGKIYSQEDLLQYLKNTSFYIDKRSRLKVKNVWDVWRILAVKWL